MNFTEVDLLGVYVAPWRSALTGRISLVIGAVLIFVADFLEAGEERPSCSQPSVVPRPEAGR